VDANSEEEKLALSKLEMYCDQYPHIMKELLDYLEKQPKREIGSIHKDS
jgi:hypothetical protein